LREDLSQATLLFESYHGFANLFSLQSEKSGFPPQHNPLGKEIPFSRLGDLTKATAVTKSQVIWNVGSQREGYRLVAKGAEASVMYLLSLEFPETH
jgi:hypothetical protein